MKKIEKKVGFYDSFDGNRIYYESRGTGEAVFFVYGIACPINHWNHQIEYFSNLNRTLIVDFRGHHKTPKTKNINDLTIDALGRDLEALLKHLKIEKAHFVGHSFGAQVLLSAYSNFPKMFKSLVLINGFASNPINDFFGLNLIEKVFQFIKTKYSENPTLWKTLWKMGIDNPLSVPFSSLAGGFNLRLTNLKDIQVYAKGVANMDLEVFLTFFEELINFDGTSILPTINCPTLVISGEDDKVTPTKFQKELSDLIPSSQFLIVPYGSHCTQLDFPDYINLKLEKFFDEVSLM